MTVREQQADRAGREIALVSVIAGIILSAAKIWVGLAAGSTAVTSDGVEALADVASSAMVYAGLWLASKPPDAEHPYGHGRYETLAGLAVGGLLFLTAVGIFVRSFSGLSSPMPVQAFAVYPLIGAVVIKVVLAVIKFKRGRRMASVSLRADAWHDVTDLVSTSVAFVAVIFTLINPVRFAAADKVGGLVIGVIVFLLAFRMVRYTVDQLVDTMPDVARMAEIRSVAMSVPGAMGIEKCFARRTGLKYHVDLHLEVDPGMTVRESHEIATRVRIQIKETLGWVADVLVHVEPSPVGIEKTLEAK
ncbi:MAG TPA: cation diffusion facilitator family transporter [Bryobacteraceae bacterium]|jgi:cation diffusion facilitator family transporter|nr:cation diffusion facilitator family transporter [Bryobacteraceae bacterium]